MLRNKVGYKVRLNHQALLSGQVLNYISRGELTPGTTYTVVRHHNDRAMSEDSDLFAVINNYGNPWWVHEIDFEIVEVKPRRNLPHWF